MPWPARWIMLAFALCAPGCAPVMNAEGPRSPLAPLTAAPESLTLEIFSAPAGLADTRIDQLWADVDEQQLPFELRRDLQANGIRAGVVGPHVPEALAELLNVTDQAIAPEQRVLVSMNVEPGPELRVVQPRIAERRDLVVAPPRDSVSLLRPQSGGVNGQTYDKAECRFDLRAFPEPDGRVRLELVPELHHGEIKTKITGNSADGMLVWKPERSKEVFDELKVVASLAPGQMLLLTCQGDKPLSVGHHFFAHIGPSPQQKLWVLRLAQAGQDRAFLETPAPAGEESPLGVRE